MITKQIAMVARNFEHATLKNKDGTPARCHAIGKCKVWKTWPNDFKLPVKCSSFFEDGMYDCFYITNDNANEWNAV